jgi:hypothetical protein
MVTYLIGKTGNLTDGKINNMSKSGIYCIENIIDGKKYIGYAIDINRRWQNHRVKYNILGISMVKKILNSAL